MVGPNLLRSPATAEGMSSAVSRRVCVCVCVWVLSVAYRVFCRLKRLTRSCSFSSRTCVGVAQIHINGLFTELLRREGDKDAKEYVMRLGRPLPRAPATALQVTQHFAPRVRRPCVL